MNSSKGKHIMRILLAEDDQMVGEGLQKSLSKSGYCVDWVQDGEDVCLSVQNNDYALLILDLGLPRKKGVDVLRELRSKDFQLPILILTAQDEIVEKIQCLDMGADDYMLKPFSLGELEARLRVLLRRKGNYKTNEIRIKDLMINIAEHRVYYSDAIYDLSSKEFTLLRLLMENPKSVFSRQQLEARLYGWMQDIESNAIEVHIYQIRKKLGKGIIKNNRGIGYRIGVEP